MKTLLPFAAHHFYLCGPDGFMRALYRGLREMGIDADHIYYEFFADGDLGDRATNSAAPPVPEAAPVRFAASNVEGTWTPKSGALLDMAEAAGLRPKFNCRKGRCGTCATQVLSGTIAYDKQPAVIPPDGHALICCARPASAEDVVVLCI